jgi:hypothetical protein
MYTLLPGVLRVVPLTCCERRARGDCLNNRSSCVAAQLNTCQNAYSGIGEIRWLTVHAVLVTLHSLWQRADEAPRRGAARAAFGPRQFVRVMFFALL